jgi:hypothetical protein
LAAATSCWWIRRSGVDTAFFIITRELVPFSHFSFFFQVCPSSGVFFFPEQRVEKIEILLFLRTALFMSSEHSWNGKHLFGARQLGRVSLRQ